MDNQLQKHKKARTERADMVGRVGIEPTTNGLRVGLALFCAQSYTNQHKVKQQVNCVTMRQCLWISGRL